MKALTSIAGALVILATGAYAADPAAGRKVAAQCQGCHGIDGIATLPVAPNIAGENAMYLTAQLKAYQQGQRQNEMMSVVAKGLTDEQIANVAAWYESIEVTAKIPD